MNNKKYFVTTQETLLNPLVTYTNNYRKAVKHYKFKLNDIQQTDIIEVIKLSSDSSIKKILVTPKTEKQTLFTVFTPHKTKVTFNTTQLTATYKTPYTKTLNAIFDNKTMLINYALFTLHSHTNRQPTH